MKPITLDAVLHPQAVNRAWDKVRSNRGAAGEDSVTIDELLENFVQFWPGVEQAIRTGRYHPAPLRAVSIPKPAGGVRRLAIPSVVDRIIQQAIAAAMTARWEQDFPDCSYAYRPGRGAADALESAMTAAGRYNQPVALRFDIKEFFDSVPHPLCKDALDQTPCCPALVRLAMAAISTPLAAITGPIPRACGIPQGSPLSPLLANIILLPFDQQMLTLPGHYLRYADDMMLLCEDENSANTALLRAKALLSGLGLNLNTAKTRILPMAETTFLGCSFQLMGRSWVRRLPQSTLQACCEHLASLRESGRSEGELRQFLTSWMAYFLPTREDRAHHAAFLNVIRETFFQRDDPQAPWNSAATGNSRSRPPQGFAYDGSHSAAFQGWNKAAWAGRFLLRRVRFGLTFRRKGFMPVPSGLCINIMGHRIHIRL